MQDVPNQQFGVLEYDAPSSDMGGTKDMSDLWMHASAM